MHVVSFVEQLKHSMPWDAFTLPCIVFEIVYLIFTDFCLVSTKLLVLRKEGPWLIMLWICPYCLSGFLINILKNVIICYTPIDNEYYFKKPFLPFWKVHVYHIDHNIDHNWSNRLFDLNIFISYNKNYCLFKIGSLKYFNFIV